MNLISFSLYGTDPLYLEGAVRNAEFIEREMKDWQAVYFLATGVSVELETSLKSHKALVFRQQKDWHANGMFWRFQAFTLPYAERVLIRDVDSRIGDRDCFVISEWCKSGKEGHIVRDHPLHTSQIMGGLWGAKRELLESSKIWSETNKFGVEKGQDQEFLNLYVYPMIVDRCLIHDSFQFYEKNSQRIGRVRENGEFLGEVVDEFENRDFYSRQFVSHVETSKFLFGAIRILNQLLQHRVNFYIYYYKIYLYFQNGFQRDF
jgi:protein O-GlcNAc transferase